VGDINSATHDNFINFCSAAGAEQMMQEFKTHTHRKRNRWDEAGQTTAIVGIPNKHSNIQTFKHSIILYFFKLKRTKYV
jgi:hypothetical protein